MTLDQALAKIEELAAQNIALIERLSIVEDALHAAETHKCQLIDDHAAHVEMLNTKFQTHSGSNF